MFHPASSWPIVVALAVVATFAPRSAQEPAPQPESLEARVARLENLVFATSKLAVYDAERNLAALREQRRESERLFLKGIITDAQLEADRFAVERAVRELDLARSETGGFAIATHIDFLEAEYQLQQAVRQLEYSQNAANRGFSSLSEIEQSRWAVERAQASLETARERLRHAQSIVQPSPPN